MSVRRLQLVISGDAKGSLKALNDTGNAAENTGSRTKAAFTVAAASISSALGPALEPVQGILSNVGGQLEQLKGKGKTTGVVLAGMGAAGTGAGAALTLAATSDIQAHQQLQAAIAATGGDIETYDSQIEEAVKKQEKFGHTADDTQTALRNLTAATNSPSKALKEMGVVADLAADRHISLANASDLVSKILNGKGARTLAAYGITMTKAGTAAKGLEKAQKLATTADDAAAKAKRKLSDLLEIQHSKTKLGVSDEIALRNAQQDAADTAAKAAKAHKSLGVMTEYAKHATEGGTAAIDQLAKKLKGQASAAADTWKGKLEAAKAKLEDTVSTIGQKYGPAITAAGAATGVAGVAIEGLKGPLSKVGGLVSGASGKLAGFFKPGGGKDGVALRFMAIGDKAKAMGSKIGDAASALAGWGKSAAVAAANGLKTAASFVASKVASIAATVAEKAQAAATWLLNTAMDANPVMLVVLAIGALIAAFVLAYQHVGWFRRGVQAAFHGIKTVVLAVVNFIKAHWKLLLAVLTGGVSVAVLWIVKHWKQISAGFMAVVHTVGALISGFVGFFVQLPYRIQAAVGDLFSSVKNTFLNAYDWVHGKADSLINFFVGLPGRVASAVSGLWDGLWSGFQQVVNWIIGGWNSLSFSIPSINTHIPGVGKVGGFTVTVPQIPYLHSGGIYNAPTGQREGLAMLLDGERVLTRKQQQMAGGGAVVYEQHFHFEGAVLDGDKLIEAIRNHGAKVQQRSPGGIFNHLVRSA